MVGFLVGIIDETCYINVHIILLDSFRFLGTYDNHVGTSVV